MFSSGSTIQLKGGVTVKVFVAPSLYAVSKARGIDIVSPLTEKTTDAVVRRYTSIAYCAAICAWEIDRVTDSTKGEFPYGYADFYAWGYNNQEALLEFIDFSTRTITGKGLGEYVEGTKVKKKTSLLRRIFSR